MSGASSNRKRKGSLGCLGCLAAPALSVMSVGLLGLLWWLSPAWMDRFASWRAPMVEDPGTLVTLGPVEGAWFDEQGIVGESFEAPGRAPAPEVLPLELARISVDYDVRRGADISEPNGLRLEVPAGALRRGGTLTMTPMARLPESMAAPFIGPIYDIRLDGSEHLRFARPATLSLPYAPGLDASDATLAVFEDGSWKHVASRIDREARTLTAKIDHASFWTVLTAAELPASVPPLVIGAALWAATNGTTRGAMRSVAWARAEGFESPDGNFQFHYTTTGDGAVPTDAEYLAAVGKAAVPSPVPDVPLYVQDLGHWLEVCRAGMEGLGLPLPSARLIRYDVFLTPLQGSYGASGLGGPLLLSNELDTMASGDGVPLEDLLRSVCAHELGHVAQGGYSVLVAAAEAAAGGASSAMMEGDTDLFDSIAPTRKWWIEMTAEYVANFFWERKGPALGQVRERYRRDATLPASPMIGAQDPVYYAYASFLEWIDRTEGSGMSLRWIQALDKAWTASPSSIDAAARETFGGRGLEELFRGFAFDYYHDDLWGGRRFPRIHGGSDEMNQAMRQTSGVSRRFMMLARGGVGTSPGVTVGKGATLVDSAWRSHSIPRVEALSARALYFSFAGLPAARKAKLVLHVEPLGSSLGDVAVYLARDRALYRVQNGRDYRLPLGGAPAAFERLSFTRGKGAVEVIEDLGSPGAPNRATLVAINEKMDGKVGGVFVERWLLFPPEYVQFGRESTFTPDWTVRWPAVELKDEAPAFESYRVYRKPVGAPEDAFVAVLDTRDEIVTVTAPDGGEYDYTVRVVDRLGNESANAFSTGMDFAGVWSGNVRLVKGSVLTQVLDWAERKLAIAISEAREEIAAESDPDRRLRMQREFEEDERELAELRETVRPWIEKGKSGEAMLRVGIPLTFEIRKAGQGFEFRLLKIAGWDPQTTEWAPLERAGLTMVRFVVPEHDEDIELTPPALRMHRFDPSGQKPAVIRADHWNLRIPIPDELTITAAFSWEFTRQ